MAARANQVRQVDITRALRAARAAGLEIVGYEVEPATGRIVIKTQTGDTTEPTNAVDKWLANHGTR
jgi:hypothetical protein